MSDCSVVVNNSTSTEKQRGEQLAQSPKASGSHSFPSFPHSFIHPFYHLFECLLYAGSLWKSKYEKALVPVLSSRNVTLILTPSPRVVETLKTGVQPGNEGTIWRVVDHLHSTPLF